MRHALHRIHHRLRNMFKAHKVTVSIAALILLNVASLVAIFSPDLASNVKRLGSSSYPEVAELADNTYTFKELSKYFTDVARRKGGAYAYRVLAQAHIPPNTDIHLLGHDIGDVLYDQKGSEGILDCTQEFRNACSHQIVINTLLENGPESLGEIVEICKRAPGGKNGYSLCFHGLGHGTLAYNGYDLAKGLEMCSRLGVKGGDEDTQCIGGSIMEMMAGIHDPEIWREQSKKYFSDSDPLAPCSSSVVPGRGKRVCYIYLTPHLFEFAGQKPGTPPTYETMKRAMSYCDKLSGSDRNACYGGFGKEYAPMARGKDIRNLGDMSDAQHSTALYWCTLAGVRDGIESCITEGMRALYWAGDNDFHSPIRYCELADGWGFGGRCFESFIATVKANKSDKAYREQVCAELPVRRQGMCKTKLELI